MRFVKFSSKQSPKNKMASTGRCADPKIVHIKPHLDTVHK